MLFLLGVIVVGFVGAWLHVEAKWPLWLVFGLGLLGMAILPSSVAHVIGVSLCVLLVLRFYRDVLSAVRAALDRRTRECNTYPDIRWQEIVRLTAADDPWEAMQSYWRDHHVADLHVGINKNGWVTAPGRQAMVVLGPPGSGKTTSILIPQVLLAPRAVVTVTTKGPDLYGPTAQARARLGTLWHYNPTGSDEPLPGCRELRWSPLVGAENWDQAMLIGHMLAETLEGNSGESNKFFQQTAHEVVSMVLHAAAIAGKDMEFVLDAMYGIESAVRELERIIFQSDSHNAKRFLTSLTKADERTKRNIETTAKLCFKAYSTNKALASSLNPNFDPAKFARSADTIYITAPPNQQELVAPLIVTLLSQLRDDRYQLELSEPGQHPSMYWALDELSSNAHIKRFPQLVAQSGSTGLFITASLQDLSQAERIWGPEGRNLPSFMNAVVFGGLGNKETLETIAAYGEKIWITKVSQSWSHNTSQSTSRSSGSGQSTSSTTNATNTTHGTSETFHLVDRITTGDVRNARAGLGSEYIHSNNRAIFIGGKNPIAVQTMPYYATPPFAEALASNAFWAAGDKQHDDLPIPRLDPARLHPFWREKYEAVLDLRAETIETIETTETAPADAC